MFPSFLFYFILIFIFIFIFIFILILIFMSSHFFGSVQIRFIPKMKKYQKFDMKGANVTAEEKERSGQM